MSPCSLSDIRDRERKCVAFYVLYAYCIIKTLHWGYVVFCIVESFTEREAVWGIESNNGRFKIQKIKLHFNDFK